MQAFTFGKVDVCTLCTNVDITGLVREPRSFDAYSVFPEPCFEGVTILVVPFRVCPSGAAELAIDVELDSFRGIVEEPKVGLRRVLCCRKRPEDQPYREQQPQSHDEPAP